MVTSVNTNINAMAAIQSLDQISNQMASTQSAIESGLSVNSAADNPAVFTIAQGLRGNIQALNAVSSNLSTANATIQAQIQGATSISNALNTLLQTVTQGQGETGAALAATNATIKNALSNIDAFANASTINGTNLLSTASTFSVVSNVNGSQTTATTTSASTSAGLGLAGLQISTGGTTLAAAGTGPAAGDTITVSNGTQSTVFEFEDSGTALTTAPTNDVTVVGVSLTSSDGVTPNTAGQNMGALLAAMQANGVSASEDTSGTITVAGNNSSGTALSVTSSTAGDIAATTLGSSGTSAIDAVNSAIAKIGATLSSLGATAIQLQGLSDFTTQLTDSVTTGLGAMVDANLSAESAQLSSLQTKQSLAIQSLSLANQAPSALMQLFR
jgi:flagellin